MISIQDLYAIKDIIESHFNSCTRGEEAKNLINIIDDEIEKVGNIQDWGCFDEENTVCFPRQEISFERDKYKKTLEKIKQDLEEDTECESQECGCDDYKECLECVKNNILEIINEVL